MRAMFSTAALAVLLFAAGAARGQEGEGNSDEAEVTRMAKEHYKAGLEAYKNGQYDVAIKELKRAYLLKRLPALLINIAATYRKMGDNDLALHFYRKYLDEAPAEAKDRGDVDATIKEIEQQKSAPPSETAPPRDEHPVKGEEPPPPPRRESRRMPTEWTHTIVDAAPPDMPLDLRVSMPVMKGVKVYVYYRGSGESDFKEVLMKRHGAEKIGRIPADALQGKAIQYYIEAKDPAGSVVKSSGSQSSPNIVMIDPSAKPQTVASFQDRPSSREAPVDHDDESPALKKRRDMDDEAAPIMAEGEIKKAQARRDRDRASGGPSKIGPIFWAGLAVAVVGVGGVALGIAGGIKAKQQSDAVSKDAKATPPFQFNDPTVPGKDDYSFQKDGKTWNTIAIVGSVAGGVLVAGGAVMMLYDGVIKNRARGTEKPKTKARPKRDEESSWYIAPSAGPQSVGLGGGFSF